MKSSPLLQALEDTGFTGGKPVACYAVIDPTGELMIVSQLPGDERTLVVLDEDGVTIRSTEHLREVAEALRDLEASGVEREVAA